MTTVHPLQLHLFDANPDPAAIPPERRRCLLRLTGALLQEAAQGKMQSEATARMAELPDE
jgi:hypothetical protein